MNRTNLTDMLDEVLFAMQFRRSDPVEMAAAVRKFTLVLIRTSGMPEQVEKAACNAQFALTICYMTSDNPSESKNLNETAQQQIRLIRTWIDSFDESKPVASVSNEQGSQTRNCGVAGWASQGLEID